MAITYFALLAGGCATHGRPAAKHSAFQKPACYPCGPCAGYFPTCWKMWPEECISCPIYGGAGLGEAPLPDQTVPPPPSGEEIIRPYDPSDPELMPLSPAEGAAPGPAPPPTSGDQEAPDDQARFDEQGRRRYRGPSHKQRRAEMSRSPIETPVNSNNSLPEWQLAPLPDGARNALAHEAGESWPPAGRQAASQIAPVVRKVRR